MVTKFGTSVAATALNPNLNFFGVELTDWTVLKARGTSTYNACPSVTSTATTNYFCIGLDAGTYEVRLGGTPVGGCTSIPVVAGDNTILCENVGAGAITVVQTGAAADRSGGRPDHRHDHHARRWHAEQRILADAHDYGRNPYGQ
jgi:hypothetical protein